VVVAERQGSEAGVEEHMGESEHFLYIAKRVGMENEKGVSTLDGAATSHMVDEGIIVEDYWAGS
jgi:hypothetical protein